MGEVASIEMHPYFPCGMHGVGRTHSGFSGPVTMVTTPLQTTHGAPTPWKLVTAEPRPLVLKRCILPVIHSNEDPRYQIQKAEL